MENEEDKNGPVLLVVAGMTLRLAGCTMSTNTGVSGLSDISYVIGAISGDVRITVGR